MTTFINHSSLIGYQSFKGLSWEQRLQQRLPPSHREIQHHARMYDPQGRESYQTNLWNKSERMNSLRSPFVRKWSSRVDAAFTLILCHILAALTPLVRQIQKDFPWCPQLSSFHTPRPPIPTLQTHGRRKKMRRKTKGKI